jgi:predicted signal transduction protein with EAL and GGDEF domain
MFTRKLIRTAMRKNHNLKSRASIQCEPATSIKLLIFPPNRAKAVVAVICQAWSIGRINNGRQGAKAPFLLIMAIHRNACSILTLANSAVKFLLRLPRIGARIIVGSVTISDLQVRNSAKQIVCANRLTELHLRDFEISISYS